jgi:hypothetical protein
MTPSSQEVESPAIPGRFTCAVDEKTHKVYAFYYEGSQPNRQLVVTVLAP